RSRERCQRMRLAKIRNHVWKRRGRIGFGFSPVLSGELAVRAKTAIRPEIIDPTAGTYRRKTTVKACSRPRTLHCATAAKAEVGRKSAALKSVSVRLRPRAPTGSTLINQWFATDFHLSYGSRTAAFSASFLQQTFDFDHGAMRENRGRR